MNSDIKEINPVKREILLEISAEELSTEIEKTVGAYAQKAKVKGFRPGKTPKDVVKRMYYQDIKETVINSLVPQRLNDQLRNYKLNPVGSPVITDIHFQEGDPLKVTVQFEVWPEFKLPEYKKIKVKKGKSEISEKDIDQALQDLRSRSAQYIPTKDRGVADGDYVVVEVKGQDIQSKKYLPTEKIVVLANHPDNEKSLNENLIGLKQNEEARFTVEYEEDQKNKKLAGKNIDYNIKVESIKEKVLPDINDDFAQDLGDYDSLEALKTKIKEELQVNKQSQARKEIAEEILDSIRKKTPFDLPETVVEQETLQILRRILSSNKQKDIKKEEFEKVKEEARLQAERSLKNHLILKKIADKENIQISETEYQNELKNIAQVNKVPLSQVIDSINKEGRGDDLRENLLIRKTVDFLVDNAVK